MGATHGKKKKNLLVHNKSVSWFEIPAINFQHAVDFYNHIYRMEMEITASNEHTMAFFPSGDGAVVSGPGAVPGASGVLLYLSGGDDLSDILQRVEEAGGRIVMPKTQISNDAGYFAIFIDAEGNKLALHSKN